MEFPANLKYTRDHEWIQLEDDQHAIVGITDFAQRELGDIVYVDVTTEGKQIKAGEVFGTIEAVKTVSDLFMPIDGIVEAVNTHLASNPEQVNQSPYDKGWIVKVRITNVAQMQQLLNVQDYKQLIGQ